MLRPDPCPFPPVLFRMADNSGVQVLWYEYNASGLPSVVRDASGRRVQYFYDASNRLSKVVDLLGNEALYTYDSQERMISKQDPAGRKYFVAYNNYGFLKSVTNEAGIGEFFDYAYDAGTQERYSMVRYSSGKIVERWHDRFANNIRTDLNGRTVESVLVNGNNKVFTDAGGNKTTKEYDDRENLTKQTNPDGTTLIYEYEPRFNRMTKKVDERGIVTRYEYDTAGNLLRQIEAVGTPSERTTEYTYDANGNSLSIKRVGDINTTEALASMIYDSFGNIVSGTSPEGNTTIFTYDIMGNARTKLDGRNKLWTYGYDNMGRLTSLVDPLNNAYYIYYDAVGNKTKEIDPEGKTKIFEYDNENRLIKMTDASGNDTYFVYDADGNLIKFIAPEGKQIKYEYDLDGRQVKMIDGNGKEVINEYADFPGSSCAACSGNNNIGQPSKVTYPTFIKEYKYDSRGRKTEEIDVLSTNEAYSTNFTYDASGNLVSVIDKENKTTTYQFDGFNRKVKEIDPIGNATEYIYDNRDNLIAIKDGKGNITLFEYDKNNKLKKDTRPMGQMMSYRYDEVGNLIQKIDSKNQKIEYKYDDAGNLVKVNYFSSSGDANPVKTIDGTYDKAGNLKTYNDGTTSAEYFYDDSYRSISETINFGSFSRGYSYTYYKSGLKKSLTMPDGTTYEYTYDNNNQLSLISVPGQGVMTYNKYTWFNPATITLPGGITRQNIYTPLMELKAFNVKDPAQNALMNYSYSYSPEGNITTKSTESGNHAYQYDDLYRLTGATNPGSTESYTYDPVGNRLTSTDVTGQWNYNANNELTAYGDVSYEYDLNGNITSKTDSTGVTTFSYDIDNHLVQVVTSNSQLVTYYYDPFGRRLWKEVNGVKTYFLYSDEGLIGEYDTNGNEMKTYGYTPNSTWTTNPLFQKVGTNYYWYQNDHLGVPQIMLDTNGRVVWSAYYDSFGKIQIQVSEIENNLRFPGQYYDQETGFHYNYFRYYDPKTGRYIKPDPIGMWGGVNMFTYVAGNPINWGDPFGLFGWADMPTIPQPVVDAFGGFGDSLTFGITAIIRERLDWLGLQGSVNRCSSPYKVGEIASFAVGVSRLAYAGIAKGLPFLIRSGSSSLGRALAISAARNTLKRVFRAGLFWNYRIMTAEQALIKYGPNAEAIIEAATRTNPVFNKGAPIVIMGSAVNEASRRCDCK